MPEEAKAQLTATEIASLWTSYIDDGLEVSILKSFLHNVRDKEIKPLVELALKSADSHVQTVKSFFRQEGIPIPQGFGDSDVNIHAPALFSDTYYLYYLTHQASIGMKAYSFTLGHCVRTDIRKFITQCSLEATDLYNKLIELILSKGLPIRAPKVEVYKNVDFVQRKSFLSGILSEPRPLIVHEIMFIHSCILMALIARTLVIGFGQVAQEKEAREYMFRTRDILTKHIEVFGSILSHEHIPTFSTSEMFVSDSTTATYSDKAMMQRAAAFNSQILSNYNDALLASLRRDLQLNYTRLYTELSECSKDALNLIIKNGWLEQAPQAIDHRVLASK